MEIGFTGIVIVVGNYGSGKTEVAVNLAVHQHHLGTRTCIADLDLMNPYFRTRDTRVALTSMGIDLILPPEPLMHADLPILMPQVAGMLRASGELAIIDVGGDDVGATVLASLSDVFLKVERPILMVQVVNPFRPNTDSVEGCMKTRRAIEVSAGMPVNKWVGNAHMLNETTVEHVYQGDELMVALSRAGDLAVEFQTAPNHLLPHLDATRLNWPLLPIYRQLVPPWCKVEELPRGQLKDNRS